MNPLGMALDRGPSPTDRFIVATTRDRMASIGLSVLVGALFARGFIPTSIALSDLLSTWMPPLPPPWTELKTMFFFPLLSAFFFLSLPKSKKPLIPFPKDFFLKMSIVPCLIAFVFGKAIGNHWTWNFSDQIIHTLWYLLFIPLGEEWLFRGWLYTLLERLWPEKMFTATNPLPVAVWGSAIAFSVWHVQNIHYTPSWLLILQLGYTVVTGLWLGVFRQVSGRIGAGILAHALINLLAGG